MLRPAWRAASAARIATRTSAGKRLASTSARRSGTWRGAVVRWGLAGAAVYYYNTSTVFAEGPQNLNATTPAIASASESDNLSTIDAIASQRKAQARALSESKQTTPAEPSAAASTDEAEAAGELEQEASQQGAFNEETGEINWDCSCLGGMAYGPCGTEFRAAFSCFVFSKEEPKGVDCIEHFKTMQNCFREHPETYGSELDDDDATSVDPVDEQAIDAPIPSEPQPIASATSAVAESQLAQKIQSPDAAPIYKPVEVAVEQAKQDIQDLKEITPRS